MAITFVLKDKRKEKTSVRCIIRYKGKRYQLTPGISVVVEYWIGNRCKTGKAYAEGAFINKKLNQYENIVASVFEGYDLNRVIPTIDDIKREVDIKLDGGTSYKESFCLYIEDEVRGMNPKSSTTKKYVTTLNWLRRYEKKYKTTLTFKDIDIQFYRNFKRLITSYRKPWTKEDLKLPENQRPNELYSINYFGSHVKVVQRFMNRSYDDGLHTFTGHKHRQFVVTTETADTIYLTLDELYKIHELKIDINYVLDHYAHSPNIMQNAEKIITSANIVKNKFLIGAFTALRVSDFNRLDTANIQDGLIRIRPKKGGPGAQTIIVPMAKVVREIIQSGFDISTPISDQKINKHIKEICRNCGITDEVEKITTMIDGSRKIERRPKCELVTTHTARRSAATNMFLANIPALSIMKITGHKTQSSFMKYIKADAEQNAALMRNNPFFM
jgi:integrase